MNNQLTEEQALIQEFTLKLETMDVNELQELEQEVIKECDEANAIAVKTEYDTPKDNYKEVATYIRYILNKQTIRWDMTTAFMTMYDIWNPDKRPKKINFPTVDTILRYFGELQFTGYEEWKMINDINNYFAPLREDYLKLTSHVYYLAAKHNAILTRLENIQTAEQA